MKTQFVIVLLPGDGIGKEVIDQARSIFEVIQNHCDVSFDIKIIPCGGEYYLKHGQEWPDGAFESCSAADAILLGGIGHIHNGKPVMTRKGQPYDEPQLAGYAAVIGNRRKLGLYANVRPIKLYPGIQQCIMDRFQQIWYPEDVDYIIVRENTEDAYSGLFAAKNNQVITSLKISRKATERIVRFAFNLAQQNERRQKVTCVDKSNIVEAHRYFRQIFTTVGQDEFPDIQLDYAYFDSFCISQLQTPNQYDIVVAPNLVGDVISDNGALSQGGLGMAASANIGNHSAMFEPVHGSAPDKAGQDIANPMATILSMKLMFEWLAAKHRYPLLNTVAESIELSLLDCIRQLRLTPDLVPHCQSSSCTEVGQSIRNSLHQVLPERIAILNHN